MQVSKMDMETAIRDLESLIKEKDGMIKRLVHLLAEKSDENDALKAALWELRGDDEYIVFEPEWDTAH